MMQRTYLRRMNMKAMQSSTLNVRANEYVHHTNSSAMWCFLCSLILFLGWPRVLSRGKDKVQNDTITLLNSRASGVKNQDGINMSVACRYVCWSTRLCISNCIKLYRSYQSRANAWNFVVIMVSITRTMNIYSTGDIQLLL